MPRARAFTPRGAAVAAAERIKDIAEQDEQLSLTNDFLFVCICYLRYQIGGECRDRKSVVLQYRITDR